MIDSIQENIITKQINIYKMISILICFFPVINIFFAYLQNGNGMLTLYFGYSIIIFSCAFVQYYSKKTIKNSNILLLALILLEGILAYLIENNLNFVYSYIPFAFCMIYWLIFSERKIIDYFKEFLYENQKLIVCIQILYFAGLLVSILSGVGIESGSWGTTTLKGPYEVNHLLAYELLMFVLLDIICWVKLQDMFSIIFGMINLVLIFLTGVRGVLLAALLSLILVFLNQKFTKKIIIVICACVAFAYALFNTNIFVALIEKTVNAIELGSITNGRGMIFYSSLSAYFNGEGILNILGGIGHSGLLRFNQKNILMSIHAHNDFIDALVQYGLLGLLIYIVTFKKFLFTCSKEMRWGVLVVIVALSAFNGFYMYQSAVVMSVIFVVFSDIVNIKES